MLWILLNIFLFFYTLYKYIFGNQDFWPKHGIPYVHSSEMGSFSDRALLRLPLQVMDDAVYKKLKSKSAKFGGIMEFRSPVLFVIDLDLIRLIMVKDFDHFLNRRPFTRKDDPTLVNQMIFAMNDSEWRNTRVALTPTLTTGKIKRVFGIFGESSQKLNKFLIDESKKSGPDGVDMSDVFGRYTLDVIASAAFGVDSQNFKDKNSTFAKMGHRFQAHFSGVLGSIRVFSSIFAPKISKLFRLTFLDPTSVDFFSSVIRRTIQHREKTGEVRNDFLQVLLDAKADDEKSPDGNKKFVWTVESIVAQCLVFIFGGFDTIESLLNFIAYELALNQDIQQELREEVDGAIQENGELTFEALNALGFLDQVISETLRKYPPAVRTDRKCTKNYKIPGSDFEIEKDMLITTPVWSIHNDPAIYPEPERFLPSRFSTEEKAKRHPYAYMPFGVGPRHCIGMRFALIESKAVIAHLVRHFHLEPSSRTSVPMKYDAMNVSLKPTDGMWLKVTPRK